MKLFTKTTPLIVGLVVSLVVFSTTNLTYAVDQNNYFVLDDAATVAAYNADGKLDEHLPFVNSLLEDDVVPSIIILKLMEKGLSITDAVYLLSKADPDGAKEYANAAIAMAGGVAGGQCGVAGNTGPGGQYRPVIEIDEEITSLAQAAELFFSENQQFISQPDFLNGEGHFATTVDELIEIKQQQIQKAKDRDETPAEARWYKNGSAGSGDVIVAGLYPDNQRIVIHQPLEELYSDNADGESQKQVLLMYNDFLQIPMTDIEPEDEEKGYTATDVIDRFGADENRVSPPVEWRIGNYHLDVTIEELEDIFDIPEKEDVEEEDWALALERLALDPAIPIQVVIASGSESNSELNDAVLVAAAKDQEMPSLPTVFFYHIDDAGAGLGAGACVYDIQNAANFGSGNPDLFPLGDPPSGPPGGPPDGTPPGPPDDGTPPPSLPPGPPTDVPPVVVPPGNGPISPS